MARTRTMTQLISDVRKIADIESESDRHPDADLERWINEAISAYRAEVSTLGSPIFLTDTGSLAFTSGQDEYTLPTDFLDLYSVSVEGTSGVSWEALPAELSERHDYSSEPQWQPQAYMLLPQGKIRFLPTPRGAVAYRLLYLPAWADITGSQTFDPVVTDGDRWVVLEAALQVATKDENDRAYQMLSAQQSRVWGRVRHGAATRRSAPARRLDTRNRRLYRAYLL